MRRKTYIDNLILEEARERVKKEFLEGVDPFSKSEKVQVVEALGRITAAPCWAKKSWPHYSASAMDGIAVRAKDTFSASETNPVRLKRGVDFVEVDTGDPVAPEFDAVIMIEEVNFPDENTAEIIAPAVPWQHVRSVGEDVVASEMLLPAGMTIGPFEIGCLLTAGVTEVEVLAKPKVAIIPTGSELVEAGQEKGLPGEITESNSHMLSGLCRQWGGEPVRYSIVRDDLESLETAIKKAVKEADLVVVCSGSSAGREDFTAHAIQELGELVFHGIATRPGKPALMGKVEGKPVLGVPGYPVSCALVFELFAKPILAHLTGYPEAAEEKVEAVLARKLASNMGTDEFVHVALAKIKESYVAFPLNRGAGVTTSLVKSDGILVIPRGVEGYQAGEKVKIILKRRKEVVDGTICAIGSHDLALDYLGNILWQGHGRRLASTNVGSLGGIMALMRKEAHMAGLHLLDQETGQYNVPFIKRYLKGQKAMLVNLVMREQGLMVKKGNPLGIKEIKDLARGDVRFVNRQKGAGTRILLDYLLVKEGIDPAEINGYQREEYSHLAVAAAVKNDTADAALGVMAGAKALDLDFIPVAREQYDLCFLTENVEEIIDIVLAAIRSPEFRNKVESYGGYDLSLSGEVVWEQR